MSQLNLTAFNGFADISPHQDHLYATGMSQFNALYMPMTLGKFCFLIEKETLWL